MNATDLARALVQADPDGIGRMCAIKLARIVKTALASIEERAA